MKFAIGFAAAASLFFDSAGAVTVNFAQEATIGGERGVIDGTVLNTSRLGSLDLRFSAGRGGNASEAAYLNAYEASYKGGIKNRQAGLGVCTRLNAANLCDNPLDDTISHGEFVRVDFVASPFQVAGMSFNGRFGSLDASSLLVKITTSLGGVISMATLSFAEATTRNFGLIDWIQWDFIRGQDADAKFFVASISSAVPVPGALTLLLSGIAGLGFAIRRRRSA